MVNASLKRISPHARTAAGLARAVSLTSKRRWKFSSLSSNGKVVTPSSSCLWRGAIRTRYLEMAYWTMESMGQPLPDAVASTVRWREDATPHLVTDDQVIDSTFFPPRPSKPRAVGCLFVVFAPLHQPQHVARRIDREMAAVS